MTILKIINIYCSTQIIHLFFLLICATCYSQNDHQSVNSYLEDGKTPLIQSILDKDLQQIKDLLKKGAEVDLKERDNLRGTPLMYATSTGNLEIVQVLVNNKAEINLLDVNKDPALNWATYYGYTDIMSYLIENGADLNLKSKHGDAVDVALRLWHHDSVIDVFRHNSKSSNLNKTEKQLFIAVKDRQYNKAKQYLNHGLSPNLKDNMGIPLLQFAAQNNDLEMVELLISTDANPNQQNRVGQTPLAWSARFGHLDIVNYLLSNGADPNATDRLYALTPLIGTAVNGDVAIAKKIITKGGNIDHTDIINDASALHWAIFYKNIDLAKFLIDAGADYHFRALNNSYSALELAKAYKLDNLVSFMVEKDKENNPMIGSWKVKEIKYHYKDTTYIVNDRDYGRFIFTSNKYSLMYNPMLNDRVPFKNLSKPNAEEINNAFKSIVFNSGHYKIDSNKIMTTADLAKVPGFENGQQFYRIDKIDMDTISLTMFDETYPNGDKPEWYGKLTIEFSLKKE